MRRGAWAAALLALASSATGPAAGQVAPSAVVPFVVVPFIVEDDAIEASLDGRVGDRGRGEAVVRNRETANCLICHSIPGTTERFMGEVGTPLAGVGSRLTPGQIRLRIVDATRVNPGAIMPAYHRVEGLVRVDPRYVGRPVLGAQEIEDVVTYLSGLEE